nr:Fe-S oxidoreductase [Agromyces seonyuensis]
MTDSAISRAGYGYATAVGFTWGFLLSTGRVERRQGLWVFTGMPKWAFRRGGTCVGGVYLTATNASDRVLGHEAVHKSQWRKFGMLMPLLYAKAGRDPLRNRFEIEAGLEAGGYLPARSARAKRPAGA